MNTLKYNSIYSPILTLVFAIGLMVPVYSQTITKSETPLSGHYPGGHVGLRGGDSPEPGFVPFYFNRLYVPGNLKDYQGNTLGPVNKTVDGNIFGAAWTTKLKILGMTYGGLAGIPISDVYNRPNSQNASSSSGLGLGDIVVVPLGLYGKSKYFDYQVALGVWLGTGAFTPGGSSNHGSGFTEMLYSVGGVYYLAGNRKSFSVSAVARFEQTFKQRETDVDPGDDYVIDWGIGSPYIPLSKDHKHIGMVGVSGFATAQYTRESGANAALNTELYQCYAIGPEINYAYVPARLKFLIRTQWEFGAKNTTQGATYWFSVAHRLKQKETSK